MYDPDTTARLNAEATAREVRHLIDQVGELEITLDIPHCDWSRMDIAALRRRLGNLRKLSGSRIDTKPFEIQKQPIRLGDWLASH